MKRRKALILVCGLIVVAVLYFALGSRNDEPIYSGRMLSQWLFIYEEHLSDDELSRERAEAERAISSIGTNSMPFLLRWIRYEPPAWRKKLNRNLPDRFADIPSIRRLVDGTDTTKARVARHGFELLGTNAVSAIPELRAILNDPNTESGSGRAVLVLSGMGTPGFDELVSALSNVQLPNRYSIVFALRISAFEVGTNACLPSLVKALSDQDWRVRRAATSVLEQISPETLKNAAAQLPP